mgnify:CR=1 FL=1
MTHAEANILVNEIHKNKGCYLSHQEATFLEDLSFSLQFEDKKIADRDSKLLQKIYRKTSKC